MKAVAKREVELRQFPSRKKKRRSFVERSLVNLTDKMEQAIFAEELARTNGLLQKIDPRVKIIGLFALILDATLARNIVTILIVLALAVLLAVLSEVPLRTLLTRAWLGALVFTGVIVIPAIFMTPGKPLLALPLMGLTITATGVKSALYLICRVETTVTLSLLLVLSTLWVHILKALRVFGVPVVFVVILGMTYRYLFVMLETARNMFEARQSRLIGALDAREKRRLAASGIGVLLMKSFQLNAEVYLAMQSRGFRGEVYTLDDFAMQRRDWLALLFFITGAGLLFWLGRQEALDSLRVF